MRLTGIPVHLLTISAMSLSVTSSLRRLRPDSCISLSRFLASASDLLEIDGDAVADLGDALEIPLTLRDLLVGARPVELLLELADRAHGALLVLPARPGAPRPSRRDPRAAP